MDSSSTPPQKKNRPLWLRIAIYAVPAFFIVLVIALLFLRSWLNGYLQSEAFRDFLGKATSRQINARCKFEPFHFGMRSIDAEAFKAEGTQRAVFSELDLEKIHTTIALNSLLHHMLEIDEVSVAHLQISLGHTGAPPVPENEIGVVSTTVTTPDTPSRFAWLTPKLDLRELVVHDTNVLWGEKTPQAGSVTHTEVTMKPDGDAWNVVLKSGTISQKGGPDLKLDHINVHYMSPDVSISEGLLVLPAGGNIALNGDVNTEKHLDVHAKISRIPLKPFLPPDMRAKIKGIVFADVTVSGSMPMVDAPEVSGSGHLEKGDIQGIQGFPMLDYISKFTHTPNLSRIPLHKASADFVYAAQKVTVSNIDIESQGLIAVQGGFVINNGNINGTFQIGVPHNLLMWLPGLEAKVFTVARGNYRWATMHLTGPLKSPKEDLKARIELAFAMSGIDLVTGAVKELPKVPEVPKKVLDGIIKTNPFKK